MAASLTEAEAAEAAPKKAADDKEADKATRGSSFQTYKSREMRCRFSEMEVHEIMIIDVLRCLVPLTSDEGPIARSTWDIMPNNLATAQ